MCLCVLVFTFILFYLLMVGLVVCIMYVLPFWRNKDIYKHQKKIPLKQALECKVTQNESGQCPPLLLSTLCHVLTTVIHISIQQPRAVQFSSALIFGK